MAVAGADGSGPRRTVQLPDTGKPCGTALSQRRLRPPGMAECCTRRQDSAGAERLDGLLRQGLSMYVVDVVEGQCIVLSAAPAGQPSEVVWSFHIVNTGKIDAD